MAEKSQFKHGHLSEDDFDKPAEGSVLVIMGSPSDWSCVEHCCQMLDQLCVPFVHRVVSAHRTPERMHACARTARTCGYKVIIACAGGSAHLPGMVASETTLPVLGVAPSKPPQGNDAMWSMVRMPSGAPLSFMGFEKAGAINAALFAARILGLTDEDIDDAVKQHQVEQEQNVPHHPY